VVLRANTNSYRTVYITAKQQQLQLRTTWEGGLQLLRGGLKRVQERGLSDQVVNELRIFAT
jgi:hypothetical protein